MKNRYLAVACAAALCGVTHVASADTEAGINEVVVTATRSERTLADIPVSATVLDSATIQDTPAQSLDDVLRHVP